MIEIVFSRIGWFVLLLLLQAMVFNHVHLTHHAIPLPYLYLLLILPGNTPRWTYLVVGFAMGLMLDLFTNTPGMAAASLCAVGFCTPLLLNAFAPKDKEDEALLPSARVMGWGAFLRYAFSVCLLHCWLFFSIEAFSFFNWQELLLDITCSTGLTFLLVFGFELIRNRSSRRN